MKNSDNYIDYCYKKHGDCKRTKYRGADKSLAQTGKKQATATEDFDLFYLPTLMHNSFIH